MEDLKWSGLEQWFVVEKLKSLSHDAAWLGEIDLLDVALAQKNITLLLRALEIIENAQPHAAMSEREERVLLRLLKVNARELRVIINELLGQND